MDEQTDNHFIQVITLLAKSYQKLFKDLFKLINLEAILAKNSLIKIIGLLACAILIFFSTWLSVLSLLVAWLIQLHFSWLMALSIIVLINIFILTMIFIIVLQLKQNLTFAATRRQIAQLSAKNEDESNE